MKVFFTSALIEDYYDNRKKEYIESFDFLKTIINKDDIYIVECYSLQEHTFLNDLHQNVFYTKTDDNYKNKGVKEILGLIKFINSNTFNDDDIILKITGRYKLLSDFFINDIITNKDMYDVFIRKDSLGQVFCGCFSIKFRFLKDFLFNYVNINHMERNMINIERELSDYIRINNIKNKEYKNIFIMSNINNNDLKYW